MCRDNKTRPSQGSLTLFTPPPPESYFSNLAYDDLNKKKLLQILLLPPSPPTEHFLPHILHLQQETNDNNRPVPTSSTTNNGNRSSSSRRRSQDEHHLKPGTVRPRLADPVRTPSIPEHEQAVAAHQTATVRVSQPVAIQDGAQDLEAEVGQGTEEAECMSGMQSPRGMSLLGNARERKRRREF